MRMRPGVARAHLVTDRMDQEQRPGDVRVDHVSNIIKGLIQKRPAQPVACIRYQHSDGTPDQLSHQFLDTLRRRQVCLDRFDSGAGARSCSSADISGRSAAMTRSKPFWAHCRAISSPIPLEAPVTTARGRREVFMRAVSMMLS